MDLRFAHYNTHHNNPDHFEEHDPQLRRLRKQRYIFESPLIKELPVSLPGIYSITGGRQVGKTTLLKQWILHLIKQGVPPKSIVFLAGEIIDDHHALIRIIQSLQPCKYILIDEVTYIKEWARGIKFLADSGSLDDVVVILTGSDLVMIQESRMSFPGRRGKADKVDFHLDPLSFYELVNLKNKDEEITDELLIVEFENYLQHGGYLTAINDMAEQGKINLSTFAIYSDWIRGDVLKRGKNEHYLKEFLKAVIKTYGSQVTWNSLSHHLSIDHPKTIQDYAELLGSMDALFIQCALIEDKLTAAPKKAKKLYFSDPFIYHAVCCWLSDTAAQSKAHLVEGCVVTQIKRFYQTFYIKGQNEVDIAYVHDQKFWPVEVKWTNQIHAQDLKGIRKYKNGLVLSKNAEGTVGEVRILRLQRWLYEFSKTEAQRQL